MPDNMLIERPELLKPATTPEKAEKKFNPEDMKKDVIKWGIEHEVPYYLTHSCYKGLQPPCKTCPACVEREAAFTANNVTDPLIISTK
ncbi:hypothetical protein LCGC14_1242300 [marine sediment metagenome]|uniref:7-cyano-7-deazaguanine synthase n=1 Tax=marine sediment metagenome TaxID=412755 RepID=A0A0F9L5I3_9ZZZZ